MVKVLLGVEGVEDMVASSENTDSIIAGNVGEKLPKRWVLKNTVRIRCWKLFFFQLLLLVLF